MTTHHIDINIVIMFFILQNTRSMCVCVCVRAEEDLERDNFKGKREGKRKKGGKDGKKKERGREGRKEYTVYFV